MRIFNKISIVLFLAVSFYFYAGTANSEDVATDTLAQSFASPPDSARPEVMWYWRHELHTKEGITADLEALSRVGIGGVLIGFIGDHLQPVGDVTVLGEKWLEMFTHAATEAKRLGVRVRIFNAPGWSSTGGPWITPDMAMQELVWSEVRVKDGEKINGPIPKPHALSLKNSGPWRLTKENQRRFENEVYRGDIAVLAFPTPKVERELANSTIRVDTEAIVDLANALNDDRYNTWATIPNSTPGQPVYIEFSYDAAATIRSISVVPRLHNSAIKKVILEHSTDRQAWNQIETWDVRSRSTLQKSIAPTTAPYWRIGLISGKGGPASFDVAQIALNQGVRIDDWTGKAMFDKHGFHKPPFKSKPGYQDEPGTVIRADQILDLTDKLQSDGTLDWTPPPGEWTVMRFGSALTLAYSGPATPPGTGLECDKLNPQAVDLHWESYITPLLQKKAFDAVIQGIHVDSYERYNQNWSPVLSAEFKNRRGYELKRFLPVMTGRVIGSFEDSERFLWDLRQTICDTMADNYYGRMAELSRRHGKAFSIEPYHQVQFDNVTVGGRADIVVTEFWQGSNPGPYWYKLGASPAHVYGKRIVAAEAFTANPDGGGNWSTDPWALKHHGDSAFCSGVNQMWFHVSTQQPWLDIFPGLTAGPWGQHIERGNTWFDLSYAWMKYLARCQYLLQQSKYVGGDVLYSVGENTPNASYELGKDLPIGYDYDTISPEAILTRLTEKNGSFMLPDGNSYSLLVLPEEDQFMTAAMARKLCELVKAGCTVVGPRPLRSPSLSNQPAEDEIVKAIAGELWAGMDGKTVTENTFGKGRVFLGRPLADVLKDIGVPPDFTWKSLGEKITLKYIHRRVGHEDFFFLADSSWPVRGGVDKPIPVECSFRVAGKKPQLWDAVTGEIRNLSDWCEEKGRTIVTLQFEPQQSFFLIFREDSGKIIAETPKGDFPKFTTLQEIHGPWRVEFESKWFYPDNGTGGRMTFDNLQDWSKHPDKAVKYFSGTAVYRKRFDMEKADPAYDGNNFLNVGIIKNLAEVHLNGQNLGVIWCAPWCVEIPAGLLLPKDNELVIKVANLWPNRLIGDEHLPDDAVWKKTGAFKGFELKEWPEWLMKNQPRESGRRTFATWKHYGKDDPLLPSGLMGPVTIRQSQSETSSKTK